MNSVEFLARMATRSPFSRPSSPRRAWERRFTRSFIWAKVDRRSVSGSMMASPFGLREALLLMNSPMFT
jgi:hypothetical protein